ncbi:hypothetical protein EG328_002361 [Venturia inaequalis]|uniref:Uncharacterized protein n=1 Tax=Venturia inaequalis TaxID=5025 RepID=A0A8H3VS40_VENIN|nr:hypothetical protein EG328_002361 [Venturia inaequalis]KAE9991834.1 hypothetical protein EG327_010853 [Venturia inaequalis]RDI82747.1 hypothetical protein Vi05172_g7151 [Venturia inaequalis]
MARVGTMVLNVLRKPLTIHSKKPMTGFMRDGYCYAPPSDRGNHSVAAIVTDEFLDFTASRGNDLRAAGLTDGCKWCLCVSRWKEALLNGKGEGDRMIPKVVLSATHEKALDVVDLEDLQAFAVDKPEDQ